MFVLAHVGVDWTFDPLVIGSLALAAVLYALGADHAKRWQIVSFSAGMVATFVALVSPLDELGALFFSAHMVQHEVLMIIAAPLLVFGQPVVTMLWALPPSARQRAGAVLQRITHAITALRATILHALALWIWHLPSLYQATLGSDFIHALQHVSFFGTAALFWWALTNGRYGRISYGVAVFYVFITGLHSGILGALIAFSPHVWYPIYGTNALEDQQLAGFIMWIPAGVLTAILGVSLFAAWLGQAERRVAITEQR